jgi:hypothetical protein
MVSGAYLPVTKGIAMVDFTQATNQQLYEIAMNEKYRMAERYAAAHELQRRRKDALYRNRPVN